MLHQYNAAPIKTLAACKELVFWLSYFITLVKFNGVVNLRIRGNIVPVKELKIQIKQLKYSSGRNI